jgi:hypothetical protein
MDEIDLYTTLRTQEAFDLTPYRERARARLAEEMAGSGSRARARRFASLPVPARTALAAGGAALAVGGAVVLPTVLSPGHEGGSLVTSAWAVQARKDGTVKVTIKDASDPAGLQRALRALGINAFVVSPRGYKALGPGGCHFPARSPLYSPVAVQRAVVPQPPPVPPTPGSPRVLAIIHPAAMPKGSALFILDALSALPNGGHILTVGWPTVLKSDKLPQCVRHPHPVPATPSTSPSPAPSASPSRATSPEPTPSHPGS